MTKPTFSKLLQKKEILLWAVFLLVGFFAAVNAFSSGPKQVEQTPESPDSLETFIPSGHLLIPIEVANADRLEGVLGQNGIVDLYQPGQNPGERAKLVGKRLRMLRAPMNPQTFAVLLRDAEVDRFLATQGPYIASIRPLQESAHEIARKSSSLQIDYHKETP